MKIYKQNKITDIDYFTEKSMKSNAFHITVRL